MILGSKGISSRLGLELQKHIEGDQVAGIMHSNECLALVGNKFSLVLYFVDIPPFLSLVHTYTLMSTLLITKLVNINKYQSYVPEFLNYVTEFLTTCYQVKIKMKFSKRNILKTHIVY